MWDRPENFRPSETAIKKTFVKYLRQYTTVSNCMDVRIFHAVSTTAVNFMTDILMQTLASVSTVKTISLYPSFSSTPIPAIVYMPFLAINNRTRFTAKYDSHLQQIFEQITDERMYPRYILLKQDSIVDQSVKEFMRKTPHRAYITKSNLELVTYDDRSVPGESTAVLMQYMRARKPYEQELAFARVLAWVLKYWTCPPRQADPDDPTVPCPSDLTEYLSIPKELAMMNLTRPDEEKLWVPQVRVYPKRNKSTWVYDHGGIVKIDGDTRLVYTFPKVGMTMSTILDMMTTHAELLDGTTIKCAASYEFEKRDNSKDESQDWHDVDLLVTDCIQVGFECAKHVRSTGTTFQLKKSHKVGHEYEIVICTQMGHNTNATVKYKIDRSPPINSDHGVGGSGIQNMGTDVNGIQDMGTSVHCARCMKPVIDMYR